MKIIKGKNTGRMVELGQWANDWITGYTPDGPPLVLKPLMVELDGDELDRMRSSLLQFEDGDRRKGLFWLHWQLGDDGRFTRRPENASDA